MRKLFSITLLVISVISFSSCEDEVMIKGEFRQKYILNGIVNGDTTLQLVSILRNYDVDGIDPDVYDGNTFITGADVRMWYKDTVYILKDTIVTGINARGNTVEINLYYTNEFQPEFGEKVEIEALLANGRRLKSFTNVPKRVTFASLDAEQRTLPGLYDDEVRLPWSVDETNLFFRPKFKIVYDKYFGYDDTRRYYDVPYQYVKNGDDEIPVFQSVSQGMAGSMMLDALDKAMRKLSEGDPNKGEYRIISVMVEVTILDEFLAAYYSSTGKLLDEYSISLDKTDYSNVEGGYGIFGSKIKQTYSYFLNSSYITNFGYSYLYEIN